MPPKDIMEMNSDELKALKANPPEGATPEQLEMLNDRIIDVVVAEKLTASMRVMEKKSKAKEYDERTYKRWPALKKADSDFAKAVEAEMERRGTSIEEPTALMDAANAVGMEMGEVPVSWKPSEATAGMLNIKPSGDEDASDREPEKYTDKKKDVLAGLAKRGLIDPSNEKAMERINKRAEEKQNGRK